MPIARDAFVAFLLDAKRHTYAAQGDEASATPLLPESRQLEYRRQPLLYRDVYFGNDFFVGQETVYHNALPLWATSYAGGVVGDVETSEVYSFLRKALHAVTQASPYRGPKRFSDRSWEYTHVSHGDVERFWGVESIAYRKKRVYGLRYGGGLLR